MTSPMTRISVLRLVMHEEAMTLQRDPRIRSQKELQGSEFNLDVFSQASASDLQKEINSEALDTGAKIGNKKSFQPDTRIVQVTLCRLHCALWCAPGPP